MAVVFMLLASFVPARAALDLNTDNVPDVWALVYNTGALAMSTDADGDGFTNGQEAAAGTNPFSPAATVRITSVYTDIYGVHLVFPAQAGKRYQVQRSVTLSPPDWQNAGNPHPGVDGDLDLPHDEAGAAEKYYRVVVSDADSDDDGVSDWEEIKLGFNPNNNHSNGANGPDDLTAITTALTAASTFSIVSIDQVATEPANGGAATDFATFVISRTGGLKPLSVLFNTTGSAATSGSDYTALSGSAAFGLGVKAVTVTVVPIEDALAEASEAVVVNLAANAAYTVGAPSSAGVLIEDRSGATGNGVLARYWNNTSTTVPQFTNTTGGGGATPVLSQIEPDLDNSWPDPQTPGAGVNSDYITARYTGLLLPEYSQVYTFRGVVDRGQRLYINGQLLMNRWPAAPGGDPGAGTNTATIELQAGKLYPIVYEYMARSGAANLQLYWSSTNQMEQLIPQSRLFAGGPPVITSALDLQVIEGGPTVNYQIAASGEPTSYSAANLPSGWTVNAAGLISGSPNTPGEWDIPISATNSYGTGSAILQLRVIDTGGAITRDVWSPVNGTLVSDIPLATNPTSTGAITTLEGPQNDADNYGARIRGYITAPTTGIFKFFLTASDAAELYISDDDEPANSFKRAEVTAPTGYREWTNANADQSPLLQLYAGRRYFVEVRHKAGAGADHVSVGWMQPGQGGSDPGAFVPASGSNVVVPGFVLSPYVPPAPVSGQSSLYITTMSAQGAAITNGYGSATLELSADETQATLKYNYANLTTPVTNQHIHADGFPSTSNIIFDIDAATPNQDGSYTWDIIATGTISYAQIINVIKSGAAYINVHTAQYAPGEIRGNFRLAAASQTFTPPAHQAWSDPNSAANVESHLNAAGASRFLIQATFGPSGLDRAPADGTPDDLAKVNTLGFEGWIDDQINNAGTTYLYPFVFDNRDHLGNSGSTYPSDLLFESWWKNSIQAPDQLRHRVAFALSEVLVTSDNGPLDNLAHATSDYYDMLLANTFGNFKDLLVATTLHPAMGRYLDMLNNQKPDLATGRIPNENYAREILQLFSIGLNRMHPDGSLILSSKGELIPTYDQDAIIGFSHVFTGWGYNDPATAPYTTSLPGSGSWLLPMTPRPSRHFTGQKRILNNVVMPGLAMLSGVPLDPYASHTTTQINNAAYQALPNQELDAAHEAIFRHPNTGPFICRQLIQRLVTGTPSRGYLYRVVQKFSDNGSGVRGDMKAVIKAILLDYEARSSVAAAAHGFGKQREPVSRITGLARAFPAPPNISGTYDQVGTLITVNTSAAHLYTGTPSVYLDFATATTGTGQPYDAAYNVTVTSGTQFTTRPRSTEFTIGYVQANGITTFTGTGGNELDFSTGANVFIDYLSGSPAVGTGADTVAYRSSDEYTMVFAHATTKMGTYAQAANSATITVTSNAHGYTAGSSIHLEGVSGSPVLTPATFTINTVTTNTFTVTDPNTPPTAARNGTVFATPPADLVAQATGTAHLCLAIEVATRSGPLEVTYSDWNMDSTETDLNQTPMNSPTVFNFFLPDYQFPGLLANAGLTTPEFELTSETSVIRQANFIGAGIYNGTIGGTSDALGTRGLTSFKSGGRDIVLDLRPWMGAGPGGLSWVDNANLDAFIDTLNTRFLAGKLSSAGTNTYGTPRVIVNAKQSIREYAQTLPLTRTVTGTSATTLASVTVVGHGMSTGATVTIAGITGTGATAVNGTFTGTVVVTGPDTFTVPAACTNAAPGLGSATATPSGGSALPISAVKGFTTVTSGTSHGLVAGNGITIAGITGGTFSPSINGAFTVHTVPSSTTFTVPVTRVSSSGVSYTGATLSGGLLFTDLIRDRVRAVVHLLFTSPDFTVQK